tara:strand:- start:781 stop:1233 length:453 start_codon:yes stop_codon:yes gene_type:complete
MIKLPIFYFLLIFVSSCSSNNISSLNESDEFKIIDNKMAAQESSWNNGDLDAFMLPYWKSDSLMFIGKSGITKGWNKTLLNYKKSYSNKDEMGNLNFENIDYKIIDNKSVLITGKWLLIRNNELGNLSGYYTLLWKKLNDSWVIVYDHSS